MSEKPETKRTPSIHTILVSVLLLLGCGLIYRAISLKMSVGEASRNSDCITDTTTMEMPDNYLRGIIPRGSEFEVEMGYYDCNPMKRGDIVLYQISSRLDPVVKIIRGIPGDDFELIEDKVRRRWSIKIDGDFVNYKGKPYFFGRARAKSPLHRYGDRKDYKLGENDAIVFSEVPPGIQDSGTFGAVSRRDLIGRIIPPQN